MLQCGTGASSETLVSLQGVLTMSNVLICEDDAFLAADLSTSVEAAGHAVLGIYGNAGAALIGATADKPDIAIIDLELADGHTGSGLAQALHTMGVKVIVLSGHPNVGTGLGTVPHTYAAKPVSPEMIDFLLNPARQLARRPTKEFAAVPLASA
jgi:ActR/RegA family two-component response regulator